MCPLNSVALRHCAFSHTQPLHVDVLVADILVGVERVVGGGDAGTVGVALNAESVGCGFTDIDVHLGKPVREEVDFIGEEGGCAVDELGELWDCLDEVRGGELADPFGWFLASLGLELDFQDSVGEALDVFRGELVERPVDADVHAAPVVAAAGRAVPVVLADEGELSVEGDTDSGVAGELEGSTVVETADGRLETLHDGGILDLSSKRFKLFDFLGGFLALFAHLLEGLADGVLALEERADVLFLQRETGFDGLLAGPVFAMGFTLDENGGDVHAAVPAETHGFRAFVFAETAEVEVKVAVVIVDGGDGGVLFFEFLVGIEDQDGEMLLGVSQYCLNCILLCNLDARNMRLKCSSNVCIPSR